MASLALFAPSQWATQVKIEKIRGTPLEIGGGLALYFVGLLLFYLFIYFFLGGGVGGGGVPRTYRNPLP